MSPRKATTTAKPREKTANAPSPNDDAQALVQNNLPLVKYVLGKLSRNLPPMVDRDDLYAAGSMGLLEAARRYDPSRKVPFHSYAIPRIWGAMVDEMRSHDRLSSDMREQVTRLEACRQRLQQEKGGNPSQESMAEQLGITVERVARLMTLATVNYKYATTDGGAVETEMGRMYVRRGATPPRTPFEEVSFRDRKAKLAECIGSLPKREKEVIMLRYHEGLYLHEIGKLLNVSESRVCQIHTQALKRMKKTLKDSGIEPA